MMFGDGVNSARIRVRPKGAVTSAKAQQDWAWQPGGPWWSPSQQGFQAANARRRLSQWLPNKGTINTLVTQGGEILRDRARDMVRNNPHAASAADSYCGNLIGTGIRPSSLIPDPTLRTEVNKLWAQWACECDSDGMVDFYGLQELVARALFEAGEVFLRYRPRSIEDGLCVPLQLHVIESDMLDFSYNLLAENGNLIMNGVEFDNRHQRVAYHFWPYHPGQIIITPLRDFRFRVRVPAEEILHIFKPRRPGDVRGVPMVASALVKLFMLDQYDDAELDRKKVAAMFAGFVKSPQPEEMLIQDQSGPAYPWEPDEGLVTLEPGTIQTLLPGEDITFSAPAAVGGDYEPFQYRQLLPVFQAMGVPYTLGAGDLRHANYSSLRGAIVEYRRRLAQVQNNVIVHQMCRPIWERWLRDAVLSESIDIPDFAKDPRMNLSVRWIPPKFEWVDPLKDQQAEKLAVDAGFKSRSDVIDEMGDDPLDTDMRIKQDHLREKALGLDFPAGTGKGKPGAPGQPGQPGQEEGGGKEFDGSDIKEMLQDQGIDLDDDVLEKLTASMRERIEAFEESQHPRVPKGTTEGGQFTKAGDGVETGSKKKSSEPGLVGDGDQRQTVPFGLGLPEGSPLQKAIGAGSVGYGDAEKVAEQIAKAAGANVLATHHVVGGWTDPSTGEYSSEPTLVGEFHGKPTDATFAAEAIAHVLGPQKEVWVVRDAEGFPAARDLRLDIIPTKPGVTPQQLAEVARKVDPELLAGFTQTVDGEGRTGITLLIPEGIAKRPRAETTSVMINPMGSIQPMEVLVNPRERDIKDLLKNTDFAEARVIRDDAGNLYVWDAYEAIHRPVAKALGVELTKENYLLNTDIWTLVNGKLVSSGVGSDWMKEKLPRRWIEETHAVPKGPATIADRADAAVMKLAGALADAGIDADVLPTAAIVDKRIGDAKDWRGYSSSLEREAGAHAVAALDDYRARLGESLAQGRGVPAFTEDLRALARAARPQAEPLKVAARFFAFDPEQPRAPKGSPEGGQWTKDGEEGLYNGPTQPAYHGSKQAGFERFTVPDPKNELMIDRAIGVHVAKDPKMAEYFTKLGPGDTRAPGETHKGGIYELRIPTDEHLLEVEQKHLRWVKNPAEPKKPGNVEIDQDKIARLVYGTAFREDTDLFARQIERDLHLTTEEAKHGAEALAHDQPWTSPRFGSTYKSIDEYLADRPSTIFDTEDRVKAVELFHEQMERHGYLGLKYINTAPMETEGIDDPIAYVIFNPRNIRHAFTGARARMPLEIFAKEFDEAQHPRGKTTPESTPGSFAPEEGGGGVDLVAGRVVFQSKSSIPPTQKAATTPAETEAEARKSVEEYAKAARDAGINVLVGGQGHPLQISTRLPWGVKGNVENGDEVYLHPDLDALRREPEKFASDMALFKNAEDYPGLRPEETDGTPEQIARNVIDRLKSNLKFLYENMPTDIRDRSADWYAGARRIVDRKARQYGLNDAAVAGAYAALSPQKDWYQNVYLGDRLIDIYQTQQDTAWSPEMEKTARQIWKTKPQKAVLKTVRGKKLGELTDPVQKAEWIRTFDETYSDRSFKIVTPEGEEDGYVKTKAGENWSAAWQTNVNIANAVIALESGGDRKIISQAMGAAHKVRSFYNNFLDPYSTNDDVTIDTHATGAGWLQPYAGSSTAVLHSLHSSPQKGDAPKNFRNASESAATGNSGTYAIYATAYREAAHELGLSPRALQSLTWEAQRGLYGRESKKALERTNAIWTDYHNGVIDLDEARRRVVSNGYRPPDWY